MLDYSQVMLQLALAGEVQGIFYWAAVYSLLIGLYSLAYQVHVNAWPGVPGQLVNMGARKFGARKWVTAEQEYVANALYTYRVEEKEYQGSRVSTWSIVVSHNMLSLLERQLNSVARLPGDKVMVYYNPKNPKKCLLIKPGVKSQVITAVVTSLPLLLFWLRYGNNA